MSQLASLATCGERCSLARTCRASSPAFRTSVGGSSLTKIITRIRWCQPSFTLRSGDLGNFASPSLQISPDRSIPSLVYLVVPTKIIVIFFECRRALAPRLPILRLLQCARLPSHGTHDHSGDLVLECPRIQARSVKALGPDMLASLRVDQLRYDSHPVAVLADAAFDHVADAEVLSNLPHIDSLALVSEGGAAGDNHQVREVRERRDDVFGDPITQITKVLVGAEIIKWENGYRGNSRRNIWSLLLASYWLTVTPKLDFEYVFALR